MDINNFKSYKKVDYLNIHPTSGTESILNNSGDVSFSISSSSNPLDISNAFFYYEMENEDYDENCTPQNNFFPALFSNFRLMIGTTELENINYPEIVSTILNFVKLNDNANKIYGEIFNWIPDSKEWADKSLKIRKEF